MARLGGIGMGLDAGMTALLTDSKNRDELALRQRTADLQEKQFGLQEQQFGMQKEKHGFEVDAQKRKIEQLDIDEIGKMVGDKDRIAYEYGVEHAMRNGFVETNPATGKRMVRREDFDKTMSHLDTAQGVAEISKRKIDELEARIPTIMDPAERSAAMKRLEMEKINNDKARDWMKVQETAKQKGLDRASEEKRTAISAAEKPGEAEYRRAVTDKARAEADYYTAGRKEHFSNYKTTMDALNKYMLSDSITQRLDAITDPTQRETVRKRLQDEFVDTNLAGQEVLRKKLLGGAPLPTGQMAAPPVSGARQGKDGNWYVVKDGKTYRVDK